MRNLHDVEVGTVAFAGGPSVEAEPRTAAPRYPTDDEIARLIAQSRVERSKHVMALIGDGVAAIAKRIADWRRAYVNRRAVAVLDDRMLRDIGLDPAAVRRGAIVFQGPWV